MLLSSPPRTSVSLVSPSCACVFLQFWCIESAHRSRRVEFNGTRGMAHQSSRLEDDELPQRRGIGWALRRLAGASLLDRDGHHIGTGNGVRLGELKGKLHGTQGGHHPGQRNGHHCGTSSGADTGTLGGNQATDPHLVLSISGDTVWLVPSGTRPLPNADEHAREFLSFLQRIELLPGRWISADTLQHHLYPEFLNYVRWPAQPWITVAKHFKRLRGVKKRQKDRRVGTERVGSTPTEYFVPKVRRCRTRTSR